MDDVVVLAGAVRIPSPIEQLDETHAGFAETPGQQAVIGKRSTGGIRAVHAEDGLGFVGDVHHLGNRDLHTEREFVLRYARECFGIAFAAVLVLVQIAQCVE